MKYLTEMYGNAVIFPGTLADEIKYQHFKNVYPKGITKTRTALDSLFSVERKQREMKYPPIYFQKLMTMGIKKPKLIHPMAMPLTVQVMVPNSSYALVYSVLIFLLLLRFQKAKGRSQKQLEGSNLN